MREPAPRNLAIAALLAGALVPLGARALGLGEISVQSRLHERFDATIEVVSPAAGDVSEMVVRLADAQAHGSVGIQRAHLLTGLRFEPVSTADGAYIHITSEERIREPSLNFVVEVQWPRGRMLREYSVLLEPPG